MPQAITVLGDANVDLTLRGGATNSAVNSAVRVERGGAAANTAVALARLGQTVTFAGMVGADAFGETVRADLQSAGVDTTYLFEHPKIATQQVVYALDEQGRVWANGVIPPLLDSPLFTLTPDRLDIPSVTGARWVHVVGLGLLAPPIRDTVLHLLHTASAAGVPASLDINLRGLNDVTERELAEFRSVVANAVGSCAVVLGGAEEFAQLWGEGPSVDQIARHRALRDTELVIRTEQAATVILGRQVTRAPSYPVAVVDAVGAGDVFDAGYIARRLAGADPGAALRYAHAVAALHISNTGARRYPTDADVNAFLATRAAAPSKPAADVR